MARGMVQESLSTKIAAWIIKNGPANTAEVAARFAIRYNQADNALRQRISGVGDIARVKRLWQCASLPRHAGATAARRTAGENVGEGVIGVVKGAGQLQLRTVNYVMCSGTVDALRSPSVTGARLTLIHTDSKTARRSAQASTASTSGARSGEHDDDDMDGDVPRRRTMPAPRNIVQPRTPPPFVEWRGHGMPRPIRHGSMEFQSIPSRIGDHRIPHGAS